MITKETIRKLAALARIDLKESEEEKFQTDLESILGYVQKLEQAETSGVEAVTNITGLENSMREDARTAVLNSEASELIEAAPEKKDGYVKVKPIYGEK